VSKRRWTGLVILTAVLPLGALIWHFAERQQVPALIRDLPRNFSAARTAFPHALNTAFPLPLADSDLRKRLEDEGFTTGPTGASFQDNSFACTITWWISWQADNGVVSALQSGIRDNCL
jgi:hypothetical protein